MYIVQSFDFGGNSDVCLHCVSVDGLKAQHFYEAICQRFEEYNEKHKDSGVRKLVEWIKVPNELDSLNGITLFWGKTCNVPGVQCIASNNRV